MRLSSRMKSIILAAVKDAFGEADVYIFGSRLVDSKKGGDIDLAIKTDMGNTEFRARRIKFITYLVRKNFDIKIDVVQYSQTMDELLRKEIQVEGVKIAATPVGTALGALILKG